MDIINLLMEVLRRILKPLNRIAYLFSIKNVSKYQLKQEVKLTFIISLASFICCYYAAVKYEYITDSYRISFGVIIAYFLPLILMIVNSYLLVYPFKEARKVIRIPTYIELSIRFITFIMTFINYKMLGVNFQFKYKAALIIAVSLASFGIILYMYIKVKDITIQPDRYIYSAPITSADLSKFGKGNDFISLFGIFLYFYSFGFIDNDLTYVTAVVKTLAFAYGCKLIRDKLRDYYYDKREFGNKFTIIKIFMLIGFIANFIFACLFNLNTIEGTKENIQGFKELLGIFAVLCMIPLAREYRNLGVRATEVRHFMKKNNVSIEQNNH